MLTKSGISIITSGLAGDHKLGSPNDMKNQSEDYLWLKSPSGKWICSTSQTQDPDNFVQGSSENPFEGDVNHRTVVDPAYLIYDNRDIADENGNRNDYGQYICQYALFLGDGTTPPTPDDYKLNNCVTAYTRKQESMYFDAKNFQCQVAMIIEPTEQITIREIGCYKRCYTGSSNLQDARNFNANNLCLIDRKVLAEPLVIEEGDITTISYVIDFRNLTETTM